MLTLGIESSCDETSVAIIKDDREILSNIIWGQMIHSEYGGVVPELASREHLKAIISVYHEALKSANVNSDDIDLYTATYGPGLVGALLVGLNFAKGLAYGKSKPFVAVNHLEGHITANFLKHENLPSKHLTLVISGGHTILAQVNGFRGPTDTDEKIRRRVEHDLHYIDNWSFLHDLNIIWMTIFSKKAFQNAL